MKRNFEQWFTTMQDSIASWNYYINFEKVYVNVDKIKVELNILNSLVGSKNIETEFKELLKNYPNILPIIPLLLARREQELKIFEVEKTWHFNFKNSNYSIDDYATFMHKTGLFDLLQNHIISNLVDYMTGIEVGMDTNSRKNRTGKTMESLIEQYLIKYGLVQNVSYFKQMTTKQIKKKFNINIVSKSTKKFDFVIGFSITLNTKLSWSLKHA